MIFLSSCFYDIYDIKPGRSDPIEYNGDSLAHHYGKNIGLCNGLLQGVNNRLSRDYVLVNRSGASIPPDRILFNSTRHNFTPDSKRQNVKLILFEARDLLLLLL